MRFPCSCYYMLAAACVWTISQFVLLLLMMMMMMRVKRLRAESRKKQKVIGVWAKRSDVRCPLTINYVQLISKKTGKERGKRGNNPLNNSSNRKLGKMMQIWKKEWNGIQHTRFSLVGSQERRAKATKTSFTLANR